MTRHKRPALPPAETSEQLRARLRAFALATREQAMKRRTVPFPEHVTVLAGPLRRVHEPENRTSPGRREDQPMSIRKPATLSPRAEAAHRLAALGGTDPGATAASRRRPPSFTNSLDVVRVQTRPDYTLWLEFENGEQRVFDMTPYLDRAPYSALQGPLFAQATVAHGTVAWPGNIDIAPETLYDRSRPADGSEPDAG